MIKLLRQNILFFSLYGLLLSVVGVLQLLYTKDELMQWINARNSPEADFLFQNITYLGDGAFSVIMAVILALASWRYGILGAASFALSGGISSVLKHYVFTDSLRPLKYFEHSQWEYRVIKGLDIHSYNSFPSGIQSPPLPFFSLMALLDGRKARSWFWLLLAFLTGYSRVYLFQHFVEDAYAGSVIGVGSTLVVYYFFMQYWDKNPRDWHQKGIIRR